MTNADFTRIEALFADASALDGAARIELLDRSCADRPDLRREIESLLAAHDLLTRDTDDAPAPEAGVGSTLGPFELVERIGEGGMGEVFRARRVDGAYEQDVAIKVMRQSLVTADLLRRFRVERQILASLRHANIVTLLDGGTTPSGRPYLAMEFVDGIDLVAYCRTRNLALESRLQLFRVLCAAVQYAHQHGVVHRDLKPANILVRSDGVVKVLDFGVAKLLQTADDAREVTRGVLPGPLTPNYASPEQLRGLPVTTASDVYALGILLYELVSDARPYDIQGLPLDRVLDLVIHRESPRPSAARGDRRLRGDIDAMVLKAMAKEPAERYDSAGALASDITRFLAREPVIARAPSAGYLFRRLALRHKTLAAVSAIALIAIMAASTIAWRQRNAARREQARAEERFREVRQLANALIFKIHDAVAPLAGSTPVRRTIVDEALAYLERLEREAGAQDVTLRVELAAAYRQIGSILGDPQRANLGDRDGAIRQYEKARAILLPLTAGDPSLDVVSGLRRVDSVLTTLYSLRQNHERAIAIARESVDHVQRYRQRHPEDEGGLETLAAAMFNLAWVAPGPEKRELWPRTLEQYERLLATKPDSPERQRNVALVEKYLAGILPPAEAPAHWQRAVELDEKRLAAAPADRQAQFDTAISLAGLSDVRASQENYEEATRLLERSLTLRRSLAESDPANVQAAERLGYALAHTAALHLKRGAPAAGRPRALEAVEVTQAVFAKTRDRSARETLAYAWLQLGHIERASRSSARSCAAFKESRQLYSQSTSPTEYVQHLAREADDALAACR